MENEQERSESLHAQAVAGQSVLNPQTNGGIKTVSVDKLREIKDAKIQSKLVLLPKPWDDFAFRIRKGKTRDRENWEKSNTVIKHGRQRMAQDYVRASLLIKACINDDGSPLWADSRESREFIQDLPTNVTEYTFDAICEYWGITREDRDDMLNAPN